MVEPAVRRTALPARVTRRLSAAFERHGRVPGLRTAKTTVAAVLAYALAGQLGTSPQPVLAALTALLVVQLTLYDTVTQVVERILSVLAGVLVALGVAAYVGLTWWSLGAVIGLSIVVGLVLRLGPQLMEVPISAMLVLAVGGAGEVAGGRVYETLVGAAVGLLVNLLVVPPLYLRPAGDAIGGLADRMSRFLDDLAGELRSGWSRAAADRWLNEARSLAAEVSAADRSLARAEQSAVLNPRGGRTRRAQPRLRTALTGLEHCYIGLRNLCRGLFDRAFYVPADEQDGAYDDQARQSLADVLQAAAAAMAGVRPAVSDATADAARADVESHLADLRRHRDRLSGLLLVDPRADEGAWQQHGALLAAVDRLRVELEATVRPSAGGWRPPLMTDRQRQVVRRVREAATDLRPAAAGRDRWRSRKDARRSGD